MCFLFLNAISFFILLAYKNLSKTIFIIFSLKAIIVIYVIYILGNLYLFYVLLMIINDH